MRPKGLNYINTPAAFDTVFNIFRSFMKEKMKKRVSNVFSALTVSENTQDIPERKERRPEKMYPSGGNT